MISMMIMVSKVVGVDYDPKILLERVLLLPLLLAMVVSKVLLEEEEQ